MSQILSELNDLKARVQRLEGTQARTKRGHCRHGAAAAYLGISRETLRQQNLRGEGPHRHPDGTYSYDDLDKHKQRA